MLNNLKKLIIVSEEEEKTKKYKIFVRFNIQSYLDDWDKSDFEEYFLKDKPFMVTEIDGNLHQITFNSVDYGGSPAYFRAWLRYDTKERFILQDFEEGLNWRLKTLINDRLSNRFGKGEVEISSMFIDKYVRL